MALQVTGSINVSGSIESNELSGSISGSFQGDGSKLTGVGGTNPTTGSMPLNISGSFVDSPITVQQGGQVSGGTQFALDNIQFSDFSPGINSGDTCNFTFQNTQTLGTIGDPVIWQVTTELNSGDGTVIPVGVYTGTITTAPFNTTGLSATFSNDSGWTLGGSSITAPASSAGTLGVTSTLSVASVTTLGNLNVGGIIGGAGTTVTTVDIEGYSINNIGPGVTSFGFEFVETRDDDTFLGLKLEVKAAEVPGLSQDYSLEIDAFDSNPYQGYVIYTTTISPALFSNDIPTLNSYLGYNTLTWSKSVTQTRITTAGDITVTGNITGKSDITVTGNITGSSNIILTGGDNVSLPTISYSQVGSGFENDIIFNGSATTDVVYLTFNTGSGVGLEDGQIYSFLIFDDGISKTFTTDWIYIDENNLDRAFGVSESRLYAYENGATYYDDSNSSQFTTLAAPNSYEVSPQSGNATIGNANIGGVISKNETASAKYYIEDSGALPNAEGAFKFKIADNGDLGTTGYITFVRE